MILSRYLERLTFQDDANNAGDNAMTISGRFVEGYDKKKGDAR